MTPELHDELLEAFSYRALRAKEDPAGRPTVTLYSDRYGGDGLGGALGSARGGFVSHGNLFLKGIGHTPLFRHDDPEDFAHAHGSLHMWQATLEAVLGEVSTNLFSCKPARILTIIDQGDHTVWPDGSKMVRAIAVRAGHQLRPGHLLARRLKSARSRYTLFVRITRATGQLESRRSARAKRAIPDLKATALRVIDDHARTAAEQIRWRMTHGGMTASNMQMDGGLLDLNTQRANPRSMPMRPVHGVDPETLACDDYVSRAAELGRMIRSVMRSVPARQRRRLNVAWLRVEAELDRAYRRHLEIQLMCAVGLKRSLAERIRADAPDLARRFADLLIEMSELRNAASVKANRIQLESAAALDVFGLLRSFPASFFADPDGAPVRRIRAVLKPVYAGNRFHVARKRAACKALAREFAGLYRELMDQCGTLATEYYGSVAAMRSSITARAEFENRPLDELYRDHPFARLDFDEAAVEFRATGDVDALRRLVDRTISASMRNVDALLLQGEAQTVDDGVLETQVQTIDGIRYAVRARDNRAQSRSLHVRLLLEDRRDHYRTELPGQPSLSARRASSLRYRFSTDGWATKGEVRGRLESDDEGRPVVSFRGFRPHRPFAELQGFFHDGSARGMTLKDGDHPFRGYVFAIPDRRELAEQLRAHAYWRA